MLLSPTNVRLKSPRSFLFSCACDGKTRKDTTKKTSATVSRNLRNLDRSNSPSHGTSNALELWREIPFAQAWGSFIASLRVNNIRLERISPRNRDRANAIADRNFCTVWLAQLLQMLKNLSRLRRVRNLRPPTVHGPIPKTKRNRGKLDLRGASIAKH